MLTKTSKLTCPSKTSLTPSANCLLTLWWYGERLEEHEDINSGDFIYIPAGIPHLPYNPSETETCTAVIARTDPNEQESVKLLPELDGIHCGAIISR